MAVSRLDIFLEEVEFRDCTDPRPLLVVTDPAAGEVVVAVISGQMDLYNPRTDFHLSPDHPEFHMTGLDRECYVHVGFAVRLPVDDLNTFKGRLGPQLTEEFDIWWEILRLRL